MLGGLIGTATPEKNGLMRAMMAPAFFDISKESYIKISIEIKYTSASFAISCYSGGYNLFDIINTGAAKESIPTCMRVSGGAYQPLYYMDSSGNLFIKPNRISNIWINIVPLSSMRSMTKVELIDGILNTDGLTSFSYK